MFGCKAKSTSVRQLAKNILQQKVENKTPLLLATLMFLSLFSTTKTFANCGYEGKLPITEETYSKVAFYNAAPWQSTKRVIRFVTSAGYFNYQYCERIGEAFSPEQFNEFDEGTECHWLAEKWQPLEVVAEFDHLFKAHLEQAISNNQAQWADFTITQSMIEMIEGIPPAILSVAALWYTKKYPMNSKIGQRITRLTAWFTFLMFGFSAANDILTFDKSDSNMRALDIRDLIESQDGRAIVGQDVLSYQINAVMWTIKAALIHALKQANDKQCLA